MGNPDRFNRKAYSYVETDDEYNTDNVGFLSGSIGRTFNRIRQELSPGAEEEVAREYRITRMKTVTAVRFLMMLIIIPLLAQQLSKHLIVGPIVGHVRGAAPAHVFLNAEIKEEAFKELQSFEETLKFEALITSAPPLSEEEKEELVKEKAAELAEESLAKSNNAVSNVFADLIALAAFTFTFLLGREAIDTLKEFLSGVTASLSDSAKAFIIILIPDMIVGFHSPHGWEVLLESVAGHLGIVANASMISLFIATIPVVMDTVFKYWIFRTLTQISPTTVATLKEMDD